MSLTKEEKLREKKKIIIEALKRCLNRDVYSKITVQEVADEAGFSKGGLLHYFSSKEDMYLELIRDLFEEIQGDQEKVLDGNLRTNEKASLSALFGVEKFFLDKRTIKILLNLLLYSFEDEKIMAYMKNFLHDHLKFYESIVKETRSGMPARRKTDFDAQSTARIAQILVIASGMLESIDPCDLDHMSLTKYVVSLLKG